MIVHVTLTTGTSYNLFRIDYTIDNVNYILSVANITRANLIAGLDVTVPDAAVKVKITATNGSCAEFNKILDIQKYVTTTTTSTTTTTTTSTTTLPPTTTTTTTTTTLAPITRSSNIIGWSWNVDTNFYNLFTTPGNNAGPEGIVSAWRSNAGSYKLYRCFIQFLNTNNVLPTSVSLSFYITSIINTNVPNNNLYFKCNNDVPNLNTAVSFLDFQASVPGIAAGPITPILGWNTVTLNSSVLGYFKSSSGTHCNIRISHNSDENMIPVPANNNEGTVLIDHITNKPYITLNY